MTNMYFLLNYYSKPCKKLINELMLSLVRKNNLRVYFPTNVNNMKDYEIYEECSSCGRDIICDNPNGRQGYHDDCDLSYDDLCYAEKCWYCEKFFHTGVASDCRAEFDTPMNPSGEFYCASCDRELSDPIETEKFRENPGKFMEENKMHNGKRYLRPYFEALKERIRKSQK